MDTKRLDRTTTLSALVLALFLAGLATACSTVASMATQKVAQELKYSKDDYRTSLEEFSKGVEETKWPLYAYQDFEKLGMMLKLTKKEYGEDDSLVKKYQKRKKKLQKGETGEKIEKYRKFLDRDGMKRLREKIQRAYSDTQTSEAHVENAREDLEWKRNDENATADEIARARENLRQARSEHRRAQQRYQKLRSRFMDQIIDADLAPVDAEYRPIGAVRPGDEPLH